MKKFNKFIARFLVIEVSITAIPINVFAEYTLYNNVKDTLSPNKEMTLEAFRKTDDVKRNL